MDLSKIHDIASWISPFVHQLIIPVSLEDRDLIMIWVFFFPNTSYPFLETADFLLLESGILQDLHNLIDDSALKSNESFSSLD